MVLHNDLELLFFFTIKFRGNRTWMFVMIWAALVKKASSPTYLIKQHKSNMGLTLFNLSRSSLDTESSTGWKNDKIHAKQSVIYIATIVLLMVPSQVSSRLALHFCWMFIFYNSPWNLSLNTHSFQKKNHSFTGRQNLRRYASEKSEKHSQFS